MRLFIDSALIQEIRDATRWGVVSGATTNPKLLATAGSDFDLRQRVLEIVELVQGPVSVEVLAEDPDEMLREAREYAAWHPNIVVKIPMSTEAMAVVSQLERSGVPTNVTALMTTNQAVLAARAGATYVSIFFGRISDLGTDPTEVIRESAELLHAHSGTQIIVGSIRNLLDINRSFLAGADILTVPHAFLRQMGHHPKTVETIREFSQAWTRSRAAARPGHARDPELAVRR